MSIENGNSRVGNHDKLLFVRVGGQRIIMEEANDNNIVLGPLSFSAIYHFRPLYILN